MVDEVLMKFVRTCMCIFVLATCAKRDALAQGKLRVPSEPLIRLSKPTGWTAGIRGQQESRKFRTGGELLETDISRVVGRLGYSFSPSVQGILELGWLRAEQKHQKGEGGLDIGLGLNTYLLEYVINESPVVGKKQMVGVEIELLLTHAGSNFAEQEFDWTEFTASPCITYAANRKGDLLFHPYQPIGIGARAGLVYAAVDGDYGSNSARENRDFGFVVGCDFLSLNGWLTQIKATSFGGGEGMVSGGVTYNF